MINGFISSFVVFSCSLATETLFFFLQLTRLAAFRESLMARNIFFSEARFENS